MKLTRRIQLPDSPYLFELSLESKTVESHSLMSDNKEHLEVAIKNLDNCIINDITEMANQHQQKLRG